MFADKKKNISKIFICIAVTVYCGVFTGLEPLVAQTVTEHAQKSSIDTSWVLAFSEFTCERIAEPYQSYSRIVPELLQQYLRDDTARRIPLEEKKARALLELSEKKLKALAELEQVQLKRDKIFLSTVPEKEKSRKRKKLDAEIAKKKKEIARYQADIKIESLKATYDNDARLKKLIVWNEGKLFTANKEKSLAVDLRDNKIQALISGTVKDVSGYVVITANLQTGLVKVPEISVTEAGAYEDLDSIVNVVANRLYASLQSLPERKIFFVLEPENAVVFINENEITDVTKPLSVYAETLNVFVTAEGYKPAERTFTLGKQKSYRMRIHLQKTDSLNISVAVPKDTTVYSHTKKLEPEKTDTDTPQITVEKKETILEFENKDGIRTFVLLDPDRFKVSQSVKELRVKLNTESTKVKIEKQRSIMYWSLAAVYLSLPPTLIVAGIRNDKLNAFNTGRIAPTAANIKEINNLVTASHVMIGISSALAVNYLIQVIIYLVKADAALPAKWQAH